MWPHLTGHTDKTEILSLMEMGETVTTLKAEGLWMLSGCDSSFKKQLLDLKPKGAEN